VPSDDEPTRYFHASPAVLAPGVVLQPPSVTGVLPNYAVGRPEQRVYFSLTLDEAREWAAHLLFLSLAECDAVHIYAVQPTGRIYSKWLDDMEVVEFHAASATVLSAVETVSRATFEVPRV
jgi:hypothetical protein